MNGAVAGAVPTTAQLASRLQELRASKPHAYPRDYAALLGVTEAELTPVFYANRVQPLSDLVAVLELVSRLPKVKLMARVSYAVLEIFSKVDFTREQGLFVSDSASCFVALDAHSIGDAWFLAPEKPGEKAAILLFGKDGAAALKIYLQAEEFDAALLAAAPPALAPRTRAASDALQAARARYLGEFTPPFIADEKAPRRLIEQAAAAGKTVAFELVDDSVAVLLRHAPQQVIDARGWFNILDPEFNLHLKEEAIGRIAAAGNEKRKMLRCENAEGEAITLYLVGEP